MRVLSISSGRADVGILTPVWRALAALGDVEPHVLLTGMHVASEPPAVPDGVTVHRGGADLGGCAEFAGPAMAAIAATAGELYGRLKPDAVLAMGDRLDMLPAATATLPYNLPLVHLHGGEVTEGAIDDRVRHALTKLAHLHCAASEQAARNLIAMGEEPWRITVTGAPGLDTVRAAEALSADDFARHVRLATIDGLRLVTVHPETNSAAQTASAAPAAALDRVLAALDADPAPSLLTAPNTDPGGAVMRGRIEDFVATRDWAVFRDTLGNDLYANALRHASVMVGNSSSGIIEAALFGLPVIDVGDRQKGRAHGDNVHHCRADAARIAALLAELAEKRYQAAEVSLYGDGHAGPRVAEVLASVRADEVLLRKKINPPTAAAAKRAVG